MEFIPLQKVCLEKSDIDSVVSVLESGMLVQGAKVLELENEVAQYLGVKNVIAASNGTATLHLALKAMGIGVGDEVILPALSYVASANVIELVGAKPIFVDIDPKTFNIDSNLIEAKITDRTKAIMVVHEFGLCASMDHIVDISAKYSIPIIEDAACALGATYKGKFAGAFGYIGSFSLHPRKAITSGEGGLITTNDDSVAQRLRILRNHGIDYKDGKMNFVDAGFNYRLTDFQAALVMSQFLRLSEILESKNILAKKYTELLSLVPGITIPNVPKGYTHSWQSFHTVVDDHLDRDNIIQRLRDLSIGTNYGAQCLPFLQYYNNKYNLDSKSLFPHALRAFQKGLVLPLYAELSLSELEYVVDSLKKVLIDEAL